MLVAGLLFACMGVCVKLGSTHFSNVELVFYRSLIGLLVVTGILLQRGTSLRTRNWQGHLLRGISGTIALLLFFYCITALPLATAMTLNYTAPLFLVVILTAVMKERFHAALAVAIITGFLGIILLLHPALERNQLLPALLGLTSGLFAAIAMLNVRTLGKQGEPETRIVFYFSLIASLASGMLLLTGAMHPPRLADLPILAGMGLFATLAQLALTRAYSTGKTLVAGSLSYSAIVFASLIGLLFWHEALPLDSWLGMTLVIASGITSLKFSRT